MAVDGDLRKYLRFRSALFSGGTANADCVGCNLKCRYCWSRFSKEVPGRAGILYSSEDVEARLRNLSAKESLGVRAGGNEPTIGRAHLVALLGSFANEPLEVFLKTNGILLEILDTWVIWQIETLHVRMSLRGCTPGQFSMVTGARAEGFDMQLRALRNLEEAGVSCHPAIPEDLADRDHLTYLLRSLGEIDPSLKSRLEFERLRPNPHVVRRLRGIDLSVR